MGGYNEEIEKNAAKYNSNKENLLNRFKAIVEVPNRKGIEDWKHSQIQPLTNYKQTNFLVSELEYLAQKDDTTKRKLSN